jgi:ferredoxin
VELPQRLQSVEAPEDAARRSDAPLSADEHRGGARLFRRTDRARSAALHELRHRDRLRRPRAASSATPASTSARCSASPSRATAKKTICASAFRRPPSISRRISTSPPPLPQTARIMAKDEDLCVHCGLCAERCPTAAWDMQKFELLISYAGRPIICREAAVCTEVMRDRVNDFALKLANVNGTGSASANGLLMQAIFRMGIPVSGKNLFPSNIQGLPTWYEIRVNKNGYTARSLDYDLMVAMNSQTYARDIQEVREGGYLLYDSSWPLDPELAAARRRAFPGRSLRAIVQRQFPRSARAHPDEEHRVRRNAGGRAPGGHGDRGCAAGEKYAGKKEAERIEHPRLRLGYDYAAIISIARCRFHLEKMDANSDKILIDGNTAIALGCVYAGATVAAWYPITPSTSAMDAFKVFCEKYRKDPETGQEQLHHHPGRGRAGCHRHGDRRGWNGARAFTSTAGPGISLMNELLGFAYYAEIPAVIIDVERVGPSTGMPTRTQQGDLLNAPTPRTATPNIFCCFRRIRPSASNSRPSRLRSGRALSNAGLPDVRSRHRHERLGGAAPEMGRWLSARSRPRAEPGRESKSCQVPALHQRRRESDRAAHAAGRASQSVFLHSRLRPQQVRRLHRNPRRVSGSDGSPAEKAQSRREVRSRPPSSSAAPARASASSLWAAAIRRSRSAGSAGRTRVVGDFMRVRGFPFDDAWNRSSPNTRSASSSSKIATRSSGRSYARDQRPKDKLRSVLVYGGFPLSARHVIDGV